ILDWKFSLYRGEKRTARLELRKSERDPELTALPFFVGDGNSEEFLYRDMKGSAMKPLSIHERSIEVPMRHRGGLGDLKSVLDLKRPEAIGKSNIEERSCCEG